MEQFVDRNLRYVKRIFGTLKFIKILLNITKKKPSLVDCAPMCICQPHRGKLWHLLCQHRLPKSACLVPYGFC